MSDSFDKSRGDSPPATTGGGRPSVPGIDYPTLVQEALRKVVRDVLGQVADLGLPGDHHFYISFASGHPGVGLSESLRAKHPEELTVVLQHDFRDLEVDDVGFDVTLRFGGIPQSLRVPWGALTAFYDPSVQFMLRFGPEPGDEMDAEEFDFGDEADAPSAAAAGGRRVPTEVLREADASTRRRGRAALRAVEPDEGQGDESSPDQPGAVGEVVSFEAFRRK